MRDLYIDTISIEQFRTALSQYSTTAPSKLAELDEQRYDIVPATVADRDAEGGAYINREELIILVEWKVSHGKFRPSLKKLASENDDKDVREVSRTAFATEDVDKASKVLCALRGVGPATASLLLSVHKPANTPFFSDELFRWCLWQDKPSCGWDRSIKYNTKEYVELRTKVGALQERFKADLNQLVKAIDIEKVAYVLGKHEMNLDQPIVASEDDGTNEGTTIHDTKTKTSLKRDHESSVASTTTDPVKPERRTRRKRNA